MMHELVTISHEWKSCQSMEILSEYGNLVISLPLASSSQEFSLRTLCKVLLFFTRLQLWSPRFHYLFLLPLSFFSTRDSPGPATLHRHGHAVAALPTRCTQGLRQLSKADVMRDAVQTGANACQMQPFLAVAPFTTSVPPLQPHGFR